MDLVKDLWGYLKLRRKFWLFPLIVVLLLLGAIVIFSGTSAVAPFIYSIF